MTRSVYVVGGAATGKSTFTAEVLRRVGEPMGPLIDLHQKPNSRGTVITLRGHTVGNDGLYLGCMRDAFPGTDGLDRVSYIPGEEWLQTSAREGVNWLIGEGATLAVRRFLKVLDDTTDLILVHLVADDFVKELRCLERGSNQDIRFVLGTATRSTNLVVDMAKVGVRVWEVDSAEPEEWEQALDVCVDHLLR